MGVIIESRSLVGVKKALTLFNDHNYYIMDRNHRIDTEEKMMYQSKTDRAFHPSHVKNALGFIQEQEINPSHGPVSQFSDVALKGRLNGIVVCNQDDKGEPYYTTEIPCYPFFQSPLPDAFRHVGMVFVLSGGEFPDNMMFPSVEDAKKSSHAENDRIKSEITRIEIGVGKNRDELNIAAQDFFYWREENKSDQKPMPENV